VEFDMICLCLFCR